LPQQQSCTESAKAITLAPQPLKISIETTTDWPAVLATTFVGISGALIALVVGALAYIGQRNQVRAATANFRHGWQVELRQSVAKFMSIIARLHYELDANPDYLNSSESNAEYSALIETHARIELMLDRSKDYSKNISRLTNDLVSKVKERKTGEIGPLGGELLTVVNGVLEQAWNDIKKDLRGTKARGASQETPRK
jgi:hypothetical protein